MFAGRLAIPMVKWVIILNKYLKYFKIQHLKYTFGYVHYIVYCKKESIVYFTLLFIINISSVLNLQFLD